MNTVFLLLIVVHKEAAGATCFRVMLENLTWFEINSAKTYISDPKIYVLFPNSLFHLHLCNTVGHKQRNIFPLFYFEAHYKVQHLTRSKLKLCYDRWSVDQSVLLSTPIWGPRPDCYYCQTVVGLLMWGAPSDKRTGLSFTVSARPHQRRHSRVRVPRNSWPCFTVSDSRLPKPGGPGLRTYIPQEQGGPILSPISS
jgi:hypothetical protein